MKKIIKCMYNSCLDSIDWTQKLICDSIGHENANMNDWCSCEHSKRIGYNWHANMVICALVYEIVDDMNIMIGYFKSSICCVSSSIHCLHEDLDVVEGCIWICLNILCLRALHFNALVWCSSLVCLSPFY